MLDSQRQINIRNIPQTVPAVIRTKEPRQAMTEGKLLAGMSRCGRFIGMAEAAKAENLAMRGGNRVHHISSAQRGTGKMGVAKAAILEYMTPERGWMGSGEIAAAVGVSTGIIRNALYALVVDGQLDRQLVARGTGFGGGRKGLWRRKEGGE